MSDLATQASLESGDLLHLLDDATGQPLYTALILRIPSREVLEGEAHEVVDILIVFHPDWKECDPKDMWLTKLKLQDLKNWQHTVRSR